MASSNKDATLTFGEDVDNVGSPDRIFPDFLTPPTTTPDLHSALDALAHTDPVEIRADIDRLATEAALPPWAHAISDENSNVLELLVDNILQYYSVALQPYWPVIRTQVQASWMQVAETILLGGTEKAIGSLFPDSLCAAIRFCTYLTQKNTRLDSMAVG
ncbi:hypothetical protein [Amycolatopsis plumensis]|uniref:hypothetical protein n=1 Tax=Amycolatopsis plumensis TaxID=236508 RepID=UPI0036214899